MAPCDPAEPAYLMYEWIWEAVFPGESWELDRNATYDIAHSIEEVKELRHARSMCRGPLRDREVRSKP